MRVCGTGLRRLSFFSLDVEGSELAVLRSIDWSRTEAHGHTHDIGILYLTLTSYKCALTVHYPRRAPSLGARAC